MTKLSKRVKAIQSKVDRNKFYSLEDALTLVKECATAKFDESIDVAVQLGIDAKKSDQVVRGAVVLPAGTGKHVRVADFAPALISTTSSEGTKIRPNFSGMPERAIRSSRPFLTLFSIPE